MKSPLTPIIALLLVPLLSPAEESPVGPLFEEALREFTDMKTTLYQHKTEVDRNSGSYKYDCVGFVSYAVKQAAPKAWETIVRVRDIKKGYFPSPPSYQKFFVGLLEKPEKGWEAVLRAADLRPGDVVSWDYKTQRAVGHAVIIATLPQKAADDIWEITVYDATSTPHSEDSRPTDSRAQVSETSGRPSGLGRGVMAFITDPTTGALTGYRWTPKGKTVLCPIGAGRPKE